MSQDGLVTALRDPGFYPTVNAPVEHVETHISHVFLVGPFAYKLKKAVRLSFLDFGSREQRRQACEEEIRLNHRLAPGAYLGVLPVTRAADGSPRLGGGGEVLDHLVWMRRLPLDRMLDTLLREGTVTDDTVRRLAGTLAVFHAHTPTGPAIDMHGDPRMLGETWQQLTHDLRPFVGTLLSEIDRVALEEFGATFLADHRSLLGDRRREGRIREGHGDLKAEHVCVLEDTLPAVGRLPPLGPGILVYDCIEFSRALRCNDTAAELAFLTLDFEVAGRADLAALLVRRYVELTGDRMLTTVLPFYECERAMVRGLVDALKSAHDPTAGARARAWITRAVQGAWRAAGPCVIACCGRSGTGKSTVATALAAATGFPLLSSDVFRKTQAGLPLGARAPAAMYTPTARASVYDALARATATALGCTPGAIVDATCLHRADRDTLRAAAAAAGAPIVFLECRAPAATVRRRLSRRKGSPSDATWAVYQAQAVEQDAFGPDEPHLRLDTRGEPDTLATRAVRELWQGRRDGALTPRPTSVRGSSIADSR